MNASLVHVHVSAVCCKKCACQWHLFAIVQWLISWWRRKSSSAVSVLCMHFMAPVSEGGWCEVQMNMTYVAEHVKTWYMLQIQWLITWLMMKASTKKWQVTAWSGMSCCLQTRRLELYCWPPELWKSVSCILVDLQSKVWNLSTAVFADMMYESCPFSEEAPVETDLSLCTSPPPNLIEWNVLVTFVWPVQLMHYYLFFCF